MKHNLATILTLICVFHSMSSILNAEEKSPLNPNPFGKKEHNVEQMNGEKAPTALPAEIQWVSEEWYKERNDENAQMPYMAYFPEKDEVIMMMLTHHPTQTAFIRSKNHGKTWGERKYFKSADDGKIQPGNILGLTNLGGGKMLAFRESVSHGLWRSNNYGETWSLTPDPGPVKKQYTWDPLLVIKNAKGQITKMYEGSYKPTGVAWGSPDGFYSQGYLRSSTDEGKTWTEEVKIPQWEGVNEISILKAANGDLVAACRTDYPSRFAHHKLDHFGGLAVSISHDEGKSWSDLNQLYEWGRHHPHMVKMPNGNIVMTYVVRLGYPASHHGFPRFGVEAVVSKDNGQSWDKEHRYVLASWVGNITGGHAWFCSVQSTSTLLMPDGTLLTAFGTGFRNRQETKKCKMDIALVRWKLNPKD